MHRPLSLAAVLIACATAPAAQERLDGYFIATEICEAFQSKNKLTNPGFELVGEMRAYEMIGQNKAGGDWYQIKVPGAVITEARWVHTSCGLHVVDAKTAPTPTLPVVTPPTGEESTDNLLALSWQPAFCEYRPSKTECQALNAGQLETATEQLSIHGLWPQPRGNIYCGVPSSVESIDKAGNWDALPPVAMDAETAENLAVAMPGFASGLERHEWIKHGTCYKSAGGSDEYYDDTMLVTDAVNAAVAEFLADNVTREVDTEEIRDLFDQAFGDGAGDAVQFRCKGDQGRVLIQELWINLSGEIDPEGDIGALMVNAQPTSIGCPKGIIDPAGLQ